MHQATLFEKGSSKATTVQIEFADIQLSVKHEELKFNYQVSSVQLSPALGQLPREILLPDGNKLVVAASEGIEQYFPKTTFDFIHFLEKNKKACLSAFLLVPLCFWLIISYVIPASAKAVTPLIPHEAMIYVDQQVIYTLDKTLFSPSEISVDQQEKILQLWENTLSQVEVSHNNYRLIFRNSKKVGANAFALPGGTVTLTDELVRIFIEKPEALQAILLHEIGHVEHRHSIQMTTEAIGTTILMTYLFGDLEGIAEYFTGTAVSVMQNKFSQALESEADSYAITQLKKLNISPKALADAFIALSPEEHKHTFLEQYTSSHPSFKSRIEKALAQKEADK